jgi:hypothetical protein
MAGERITQLTPAPTITINAPLTLPTGVQLQPTFDPIELLPPSAAEKLRMLRQRSADAHAIVPEFEDIRRASAARSDAANALKRLTDHSQDGGFRLPDTDARVLAASNSLEKAEAEFRRIKDRSEVRAAAWQSASAALPAVEDWLKNGRPSGVVLEAVEVDVPRPVKGEGGLLDQIENRRRRVRELKAAKHTIESAPFPSAFAKQRLRAMVDQLSQRGEPDVTLLLEHDREVIWPTSRQQAEVYGTERAFAFHEAVDVVGLLAFLLKPTLVAALDKLVDEASDDGAALTHEAREKAEAEVMADLLSAERTESSLVWAAQKQDLPCEHRADISPQALLAVALVVSPRAEPSGTSDGYSYNLVGRGGARRR